MADLFNAKQSYPENCAANHILPVTAEAGRRWSWSTVGDVEAQMNE